ncbi:hypothetical protein B0T22DRAFT_480195 [Podospora appendiculata]|uniref:C2H2-type domain-containing protein n=1 Tax=Podospora appendiculata TaxID=314037 RepID=A0AAE0XA89_9PEZI|nr:hypothetical protein B0T22DRAFT_480195 [Podospora appendiculata]
MARSNSIAEAEGMMVGLRYVDELEETASQCDEYDPFSKCDSHGYASSNDMDSGLCSASDADAGRRWSDSSDSSIGVIHAYDGVELAKMRNAARLHPPGLAHPDSPSPPPFMLSSPAARRNRLTERLPNPDQWEALKQLTRDVQEQLQKMREICTTSGAPISGIVGSWCFLDILGNKPGPTRLTDVFALATVSYVTSKLLVQRGRLSPKNVLGGLRVWRDIIHDPAEQHVFELVSKQLWPEARAQFDFSFANHPSAGPSVMKDLLAPSPQQAAVIAIDQPPGRPSTKPPATMSGNTVAAGRSELSHQSFVDPQGIAIALGEGLHDEFRFSDMLPWPDFSFPDFSFPSTGSMSPSDLLPPQTVDGPGPMFLDVNDAQNPPRRAGVTMAFSTVRGFVKNSGDFFYVIAGCGITARNIKNGMADIEDQAKFVEELRAKFLAKLREYGQATKSVFILACHPVVETFAVWGLLRTPEQVKAFLLNFAKAAMPLGRGFVDDFVDFVHWIKVELSRDADYSIVAEDTKIHSKKRSLSHRDVADAIETKDSEKRARRFRCSVTGCEKELDSDSGLRWHIQEKHRDKRVQCPNCETSKSRKDHLRDHFRRVHRDLAMPAWLMPASKRGPLSTTD